MEASIISIQYFTKVLIIFVLSMYSTYMLAQQKTMTPDVYSEWRKIRNVSMSDSAETIIYNLEREVGDKQLCIYQTKLDKTYTIDRLTTAAVDFTGKYIVYTHGLAYDSIRTLKRKKTGKDKMPIDSLSIFHLPTRNITVIDQVTGFNLPAKYSDYLVYTRTVKKETTQDTTKKKNPCKDQTIIIRRLSTMTEDTIYNVKDYILADEVPLMTFTQCSGDSIASYTTYRFDLKTRKISTVSKPFYQVSNLTFDKKGDQLAFLTLDTKSHLTKKPYTLHHHKLGESLSNVVVAPNGNSLPPAWLVSSDHKLRFSDNGWRLIFGMTPPAIERDTTRLDDEIVNVEIWHHNMPKLFTQLESTLESDKKRTFLFLYDLNSRIITQVENETTNTSQISQKGDGTSALLLSSLPYHKETTWMGDSRTDISLLDLTTKSITTIEIGNWNAASLSPKGKYAFWYSKADTSWKIFNISLNQKSTLVGPKLSIWCNELNDVPALPDSYGFAGWLDNDEFILIYDRYDIWKVNPTDPLSSLALTNGRDRHKTHRFVDLDIDRDEIDSTKPFLLHIFDENTKDESYAYLDMKSGRITPVVEGPFALSHSITKARSTNDIIFYRQSFTEFPDIQLSTTQFDTIRKISNANHQQSNYQWGINQLFDWSDTNDTKFTGMLFFPPSFDRTKKYPLIVNFYERSSNSFHSHRAPEAHRSQINYTYYTNKGYVIFNPDISYTMAQPGEDCLRTVNSGVDALTKLGYIDSTRIALQGHSWGGYQIAYMLTKTGNRYRCAEAGAAVVNMVSAYGGIRWESGMSRMFQYEKTQSRLGKTLWQDPQSFHRNSPIYNIDKVSTPVLMMHNDEDGAVPWEQGIEYYMAMRRLNKPAWLLNYNGEPHWPVKWQNRLDFNIRMEQFFDHYLMDKPMPLWMKEGNTPLEKGILNKY
jgi:dipeptidyl aminopeptidase/acylaminoacyl peptidase